MSSKVKYHRLSQSDEEGDDGADEEEDEDEDEGFEENILFDSRLVNTPVMERGEVFELERLGQPRVIGGSRARIIQARKRRLCLIGLILLAVCLIVLAAVLFPLMNHTFNHGKVFHKGPANWTSEDWSRSFNDSWSESGVRMLDIDGDGLDDILVGLSRQNHVRAALNGKDMKSHCKDSGQDYPCGGKLVALGGLDGAELWHCQTRSTVLDTACGDLDVDGDGRTDCIVTGRHATLQAVDLKKGKVLWSVDPEQAHWSRHFVSSWTVYHSASLPDLDGDGILDLVVSLGEDESVEADPTAPGRLILLSGRSGIPIGNSYLEIPGGIGTSTPPVKFITDSGAVYILFASGSKRKSGRLMVISLPDLYKRCTGKVLRNQNTDIYKLIDSDKLDANGIANLTSGNAKGIVSPPVLVDADSDGTTDLLITEFGGRVTLLDGATLLERWSRNFDGAEIHGSPTPGHYNADLYLDFLIHVNIGVWDNYNSSMTLILDGADGSTLWSVEGSSYVHSSDLSLRTSADNLSAFLVKMVGRNSSLGVSNPPGLNIMKRYFSNSPSALENLPANISEEDFQKRCELIETRTLSDQAGCDQDLDFYKVEVLLFDRLTSARPLQVMEVEATRKHYSLDHSRGQPHCHGLLGRLRVKIGMCVVLTPTTLTGAVGDVDGDGFLDYVHVTQMAGPMRGDDGQILDVFASVSVTKLSLTSALSRSGQIVSLAPTFEEGGLIEGRYTHLKGNGHGRSYASDSDSFSGTGTESNGFGEISEVDIVGKEEKTAERHFEKLKFLPASLQPWAQSLGSRGGSWYDVPPS